MTPKFTHDCECCTFLGTVVCKRWGAEFVDLYVHGMNEESNGSVIARYSDDGPDYACMPTDMALKVPGILKVCAELALDYAGE